MYMIRHDFQRHNRPSQFGGLRFQQLSEALCNSVHQHLPAPLRTEHEVVSQQRHGGIFVNVGRRHIHSVAQLEGGAGLCIQPSTFAPHPSGGWAIQPRDKSLGFPPRPFSVKNRRQDTEPLWPLAWAVQCCSDAQLSRCLRGWRNDLVCLIVNHATSPQCVQKPAERVNFVVSRRRWNGSQCATAVGHPGTSSRPGQEQRSDSLWRRDINDPEGNAPLTADHVDKNKFVSSLLPEAVGQKARHAPSYSQKREQLYPGGPVSPGRTGPQALGFT